MNDSYLVVIEGDEATNYSAYLPDLPGCVATGHGVEETIRLIREAMAFHLASMRRDGDPIPPATTRRGSANLDLSPDAIGVIEVGSTSTRHPNQALEADIGRVDDR